MPLPIGLLDQVHDAVIATDLAGIIQKCNAAAERIYGYSAAEMIGQSVALFYFPEDQATIEARIVGPLQAAGAHHLAALRNRRKDGAEIYVDLRLSLQRDEAGRPVGMIGCSNDVTEAHRARREGVEQREELRVILDAMPAMLWYKDRDNRIIRANREAAALNGMTPAEIEGRSTFDLFPGHAEQYHRDDLAVITTGVPKLGIVEPLQTASGEQRWLRTDKLPYRDAHGEIIGVLVFAVDITEQRHAEQALEQARSLLEERVAQRTAALAEAVDELRREAVQRQQAETRLELALAATDLAMWDWDVRRGETTFDARGAELLGYAPEEMQRSVAFWATLTHPDDLDASIRAWNAHVADGTTPHYEVEQRLRTKHGEYIWVLTRGRAVERDASGAVLRMIGTARDITAQKALAEQARRHQAELAHILRLETVNCLAAELAHEINQPLGAIANFANGLATRLRQAHPDRAAMLEAAERISTQAMRAGAVLQGVRSFVRKDAPCQQACDVNALVASAGEFLAAEARHRGVVVRLDLAAGLPVVTGDPIQIEQVLVNLLRNGFEAIVAEDSAQGTLTVRTCRGALGEVEVRIADSGGGVSAEVRERIFEPFFTTKSTGLGMGLSISRSLVEAHGGRLWCEAAAEAGTTFCVSLPPAVT
jgi:PAS domain S-box-containing protein